MPFKWNKQFPTFLPPREECDCCISLSMLSFIHPSTMAKQTAYRILLVKRNSLLPIILYQWILTSFKCYSRVSLETDTLFKGDCATATSTVSEKKKERKKRDIYWVLGFYKAIHFVPLYDTDSKCKKTMKTCSIWLFCFPYELTWQEIISFWHSVQFPLLYFVYLYRLHSRVAQN